MVEFLAALPALIASLPTLFQILLKMMTLVERVVALAEKNGLSKWLESIENGIDQLEKADTVDEKRAAAANLASVLRGLG